MRKLFFSACLLIAILTISIVHDPHLSNHHKSNINYGVRSNQNKQQESKLHPASLFQNQDLHAVARQVQAPDAPIEERKQFSWWWWVVGVVVALAGGMLLYVIIKRNPRKDA